MRIILKYMAQSIFDQFTGKYQLSKTLRFELKPVGKTESFLKKNKVFEKDKTIDDSYNQAKFYFDTLHQKFINSAFTSNKIRFLNFSDLAIFLTEKRQEILSLRKQLNEARKTKNKTDGFQKKINDLEKGINERKKGFYKDARALLDSEADKWKKSYIGKKLEDGEVIKFGKKKNEKDEKQNERGVDFLTSARVLQILKYEFPESKEQEFIDRGWPSLFVEEKENPSKKRYIFDSFDKFSGYLAKFQETRKNIYADNGITTALATRIVGNFEIFLANKEVFESNKYKQNYKEIGFLRIDIFEINNYKNYLLQEDIEAIKGSEKESNSYNKIIGAFNKAIKEYRDKKESEAKQNKNINFKKTDYPLFKSLEKQILGKVEKEKQLIEKTKDKTEEEVFVERFKEFIKMNEERFAVAKEFMNKFFSDAFASEYEKIYIKNSSINTISRRWFVEDGYNFEKNLPQASKNQKEGDVVKVKKFITLADVKNAVESLEDNPFKQLYYDKDKKTGKSALESEAPLWEQFLNIWQYEFGGLFKDKEKENGEIIKGYDSCLKDAQRLVSFSKERKLEEIAKVKNYADASLRIFQMMKYIALSDKDLSAQSGISTNFYAELDKYSKDFQFNKYYDALRNFVTKKPFDEDKIKLNFEKTPPILKGFSKQYHSYLLKKDDDAGKDEFYLGILKSGEINEMLEIEEKSDYLYFPATQLKFQNLVNPAFESRFGYVYSEQTDEKRAIADAQTFIKERYLKKYPDLKRLIEKQFFSKREFAKEASQVCVEIYSRNSFIPLDKSQIEKKHENGELYLFKISSKDWGIGKKVNSLKNIHTLYFEQLFNVDNLKNPVLKISGGSEIFLREETKEIKNKKDHIITKNKQKDITQFLKDKFNTEKYVYDRYIKIKYFLHLSTVINYQERKPPQERDKLKGFIGAFNKSVRQELATLARQEKINVIGIDRGEKHLAYYSVVNQKGEILDQGSLNEINGVNYHQKLIEREKERAINRKSWEPVAKIKDLKKGYISQVVRKISDLVIEHNAIVVMEDLNMRFKQIRGGIERSIYQQLEKQLIDKFGYLIFKDRNPQEIGGALKGYQLSAPFVSFEKMGKQTGIIFYTQADYTSITDPLTGFRKNVYISNSLPVEQTKKSNKRTLKDEIQKFKVIGWDNEKQSYFFKYDPKDFASEEYKDDVLSQEWIIYANAPRIRREKDSKGYWDYQPVNLNHKFDELFKIWGFKNKQTKDILKEIKEKETNGELGGAKKFDGKEKSFWHSFIYLFNLILQLRNSFSLQIQTKDGKIEKIKDAVDFIASPVEPFFATAAENKEKGVLSQAHFDNFAKKIISKDKERILKEFNADANGAYNIARKGIIILQKIKENYEKPDLYISKSDWDKFTQSQWNNTSKYQK